MFYFYAGHNTIASKHKHTHIHTYKRPTNLAVKIYTDTLTHCEIYIYVCTVYTSCLTPAHAVGRITIAVVGVYFDIRQSFIVYDTLMMCNL